MRGCKGQNIIEYVLLVAAVIAICIVFLKPQAGNPMYDSVNATLNSIVNQLNNINSQIKF